MSKNSFTKNFNNCVDGFPIASVAAHIVLHEGLLKDIGKLGALAGLGYLGYNYGDKIGDAANWVGQQFGAGEHNVVGDTLGNWHNSAKTWVQDSIPGKMAGLGGDQALERQTRGEAIAQQNAALEAAKQQDIIQITRDNPDLAARTKALQANEQKYSTMKQQIGDKAWNDYKINRIGNTFVKDGAGDVSGKYTNPNDLSGISGKMANATKFGNMNQNVVQPEQSSESNNTAINAINQSAQGVVRGATQPLQPSETRPSQIKTQSAPQPVAGAPLRDPAYKKDQTPTTPPTPMNKLQPATKSPTTELKYT